MPADDDFACESEDGLRPANAFAQYEDFVEGLLAPASTRSHTDRVLTGALGLAGEAGEIVDLVKKWQYQGHPLDREKVMGELGDILFYMAVEAKANGITLQDVMDHNMAKLMDRYPNGFDPNKSMNRGSVA